MTPNVTSNAAGLPASTYAADPYAGGVAPTAANPYIAATPTVADFRSLGLTSDDIARIQASGATAEQTTQIYYELEQRLGVTGSYQGQVQAQAQAQAVTPDTYAQPSEQAYTEPAYTEPNYAEPTPSADAGATSSTPAATATPQGTSAPARSDQFAKTGVPSVEDFAALGLNESQINAIAESKLSNRQVADLYAKLLADRTGPASASASANAAGSVASSPATTPSTTPAPTVQQPVPTMQDFLALGVSEAELQEVAKRNPTDAELIELYNARVADLQANPALGAAAPVGDIGPTTPAAWGPEWEQRFRKVMKGYGIDKAVQDVFIADLAANALTGEAYAQELAAWKSPEAKAPLLEQATLVEQQLAQAELANKPMLEQLGFPPMQQIVLAAAGTYGGMKLATYLHKMRRRGDAQALRAAITAGDASAAQAAKSTLAKSEYGRKLLGNVDTELRAAVTNATDAAEKQAAKAHVKLAGVREFGKLDADSTARSVRAYSAAKAQLEPSGFKPTAISGKVGAATLDDAVASEAKRLFGKKAIAGKATDELVHMLAKERGVKVAAGASAEAIMQKYVAKGGLLATVGYWNKLDGLEHRLRITGSMDFLEQRFGKEVADKYAGQIAKGADLRAAATSSSRPIQRTRLSRAAGKLSAAQIASDLGKAEGKGFLARSSMRIAAEGAARGGSAASGGSAVSGFAKAAGRNMKYGMRAGGIAGVAFAAAFELPSVYKSGKEHGVKSKEFAKDAGKATGHIAGGVGGFVAGAQLGAAIGAPLGPIGMAVGGLLVGTGGAVLGSGLAGWAGGKIGGGVHGAVSGVKHLFD